MKPTAPKVRSLLAAAICLAAVSHVAEAQEDAGPYSTVTIRAGATSGRPLDQLKNYYSGGSGPYVEVQVPIEFGVLGFGTNSVKLQGTAPQYYSISSAEIAVDWLGRKSFGRLSLLGGMRIGDFHMAFSAPPPPGGDNGTEEFLVGPVAGIDLRLISSLAVSASGHWIFLPSASRAHLGYVSAGAAYTFGAPGWLQRFLK